MTAKPRAFIVDIDGTLALSSRDPGEAKRRGINCRPWDEATYEEVVADTPNEPVVEIVRLLSGWMLPVYVTARMDTHRKATLHWLRLHVGTFGPGTIMRTLDDQRPDAALKRAALHELRKHYDIRIAIEDHTPVVRMYRDEGLTVLDVAGNYYATSYDDDVRDLPVFPSRVLPHV